MGKGLSSPAVASFSAVLILLVHFIQEKYIYVQIGFL
jgi:hypothetical protein